MATRSLGPIQRSSNVERAIVDLGELLDPGAVLTEDESLLAYADPYTYPGRDSFAPGAIVLPKTVEQVQAILRIARERQISVWTVSQGRNHGYGGAAPRVGGSIVVSLREMNRVLQIDEELAWALVEPGVRFLDLHEAIRSRGLKLMLSVPDLGWGSVVGNALDHGLGYTLYGDHAASHCGMEVVLANGDLLRTGMGAIGEGRAWQLYPRSFGPTPDGIFMQSNFGIVTKMGLWLMPSPECYMACTVQVPNEEDIYPLIEVLRPLMLNRTIQNQPVAANALTVSASVTRREHWWTGDGPVPDEVIDRICREMEIGRWMLRFALYGSEELVDAQFRVCERAFGTIAGARVAGTKYPGDAGPDRIPHRDQSQAGIPSVDLLQSVNWRAAERGGHLGASPVCPLTGRDLKRQIELLRPIVHAANFDYFGGLIVMPRCLLHVFEFLFDLDDHAQTDRAYAACRELIAAAGRAGDGEYRSHLECMDLVARQYDFNDHAQQRFNECLKDALDPEGILSPGKQGIWPASLRASTHGGRGDGRSE